MYCILINIIFGILGGIGIGIWYQYIYYFGMRL
jgi:hypothetical protein